MRFALVALIVLLAGCAHTQSAAGAAVLDTPAESAVTGCTRLPDVVGHGEGIGDVGVSQAKIAAREDAAVELATHIIWTQPTMQTALGYRGIAITGAAYRCPAAP